MAPGREIAIMRKKRGPQNDDDSLHDIMETPGPDTGFCFSGVSIRRINGNIYRQQPRGRPETDRRRPEIKRKNHAQKSS
jgi:hypothetical protein